MIASGCSPLLVRADATTQNIPKVSFTFDDGLSSALLAAQTLQPYGYAGTDYIITGCVGMKAPDTCPADGTRDYMSWDDIATLHNTYGWEIGSHTVDHPLTAAADNPSLTDAQLDAEMADSKATLAAHGYNAVDFASPYGDYDNRSLATIAKYYDSHRTFQDYEQPAQNELSNTFPYYNPRDGYPYNNYLLTVEEVQGNISVATVEGYINQAKANNQWLILVFHNIMNGNASTAEDAYEYNASDLAAIASYVQSQSLPVVTIAQGLANGTNIMPNSGFDAGIADGWTTDDPANITADQATATTTTVGNYSAINGHGSYDGTPEGPLDSIHIAAGGATDTHLFSPKVSVTPGTTYTLTNYVDLTSTTGEIDFFIDEYDANGTWISGQYKPGVTAGDAAGVEVGDVNFTYTPSSAAVASASLQVIVHGVGTQGYLDNLEWLSPSPTTPPTDTTPPVISDIAATATSTTASITWVTDEASTSQVTYGTSSMYGNTSTEDSSLVTTHSVTLNGLLPGTTYHYQVASQDAAANRAASADQMFTTAAAPVPTAPGAPTTTTPTNNRQPTVAWAASSISDNSALTYTLQWSNDPTFATVSGTTTSSTLSATPTGNLSDGTWYFRVKATSTSNIDSAWSSAGSVTIDATGPVISTPVATPTSSTVVISWTTDEPSAYQLQYGTTTAYEQPALSDSQLNTTHTVTISSLSAATTYDYQIKATDALGNLTTITNLVFTTLDTVKGDLNNDGKVNGLDLSVILSNWGTTSATPAQGDLNNDGRVNGLDLSIVLQNWSK